MVKAAVKNGPKTANPTTFKPGNAGRPKGSANKVTRDLKEAILRAFETVGGESYLATVAADNPAVFCTLLGKVLPTQITGDPEHPVPLQIIELRAVNPE